VRKLSLSSTSDSVKQALQLIMHVRDSINRVRIERYVTDAKILSPDDLARIPHSADCFVVGIPAIIYPGDTPLKLAAYLTMLSYKLKLNVSRTPPLQLLLHLYSTRQIGKVVGLVRRYWRGRIVVAIISASGDDKCVSNLRQHLARVCGNSLYCGGAGNADLSTLRSIYGCKLSIQEDIEKELLNAVAYSVIKILRKSG